MRFSHTVYEPPAISKAPAIVKALDENGLRASKRVDEPVILAARASGRVYPNE